jgi:hypothetical protein
MGRAVAAGRERGRGRCRPDDTEATSVKTDHTILEMPQPKELWWEIDRWDEVWNEDLFWEDVTADLRQRLKELLRS